MRWTKTKIKDNEGKALDLWTSDCEIYKICQNINDGIPLKRYSGPVDSHGYRWLFEVMKRPLGKEIAIGTAPTLKSAKAIAECDAEGI